MSNLIAISGAMLMAPVLFGLVSFPIVALMHFLMPKAVLDRYWKEPHFRPFELGLMTNTWLAPYRTVMLMGVIAFPHLGEKRGVTQAYLLVPRWYRLAARTFTVCVLLLVPLAFVGMAGISMHEWLVSEKPPWKETLALLISLACFGGVFVYQRCKGRREAASARRRDSFEGR